MGRERRRAYFIPKVGAVYQGESNWCLLGLWRGGREEAVPAVDGESWEGCKRERVIPFTTDQIQALLLQKVRLYFSLTVRVL